MLNARTSTLQRYIALQQRKLHNKTLGQAQENAVSVSDVTLIELLSLSLKLEMVSIYLAGESFYVLHKFIYVLK